MRNWHTLSLLLHLVALALWLGGIGFFLAAFGPAVNALEAGAAMRSLNQGRVAFEGVAWTGITLLMLTGGVNLVLRSQFTGAHLGQTYMIILAIKLFLFVAMLVHHTLQVFKYGPKIAALTPGNPCGWRRLAGAVARPLAKVVHPAEIKRRAGAGGDAAWRSADGKLAGC